MAFDSSTARHWLASALCLFAFAANADPRADYLKLLERPRVAPEPLERSDVEGDLTLVHFSYLSEAKVRVPGILYRTAGEGRRPVAIVLHGTGGSKEGEAKFLKRLAQAGFIAVSIDGRYHGERGTMADYNAVLMWTFIQSADPHRVHPLYYDTSWDVMRLIDYLIARPDVDAKRIGLMGISKGGIETWLTAAADERVACAIPCISMQSFKWEVEHDRWQARMKVLAKPFAASAKFAGVEKPDGAFWHRFLETLCPGSFDEFDGPSMILEIAPRPLLLINGEKDALNPLEGLALCVEAAKPAYHSAGADDAFKEIIEEGVAHAVTPESYDAALEWFKRWLKPQ